MCGDDLFDFVPDMDFDGDRDLEDYLLYEDELDMLMEEENKQSVSFCDEEDEGCDYEEIDFEDDGLEDTFDDEENLVIPIKISFDVSMKESEENDFDDKEGCLDVTDRIPDSFIQRDLEKEKELGIDDLKFYCYWMRGFSGILIIVGEVISHNGIKEPFYFKAIAKDAEGDKFLVKDNFDYTGGSGFVIRNIYPQIGFNRYPFEFELHLSPQKLEKSTIQIVPVRAKEVVRQRACPPKLNCNTKNKKNVSVAELKQYDKIPKAMVDYCIQEGGGLTDLKVNFFKDNDIYDDDYFLDQLSLTYEYSGRLSEDILMYILIYNEKDELIQFLLTRLDEGEWVEEEGEDFINMPHGEMISRIVVCTTAHPLNFHNLSF